MDTRRKSFCLGITGSSGTGKTAYAERYMVGSNYARVFIFDHQDGEFASRLNLIPCYDFDEMLTRARTERFLAFDYSTAYPGEKEEAFDLFCSYVYDFGKQNLQPLGYEALFVCDELQFCVAPNDLPHSFKVIIQTGRRAAVDVMFMSQQPNGIHNAIRNQISEYVTFRMIDERALNWSAPLGIDSDEIIALPDLSYIWRDTRTGEQRVGSISYDVKKS